MPDLQTRPGEGRWFQLTQEQAKGEQSQGGLRVRGVREHPQIALGWRLRFAEKIAFELVAR